MYGPWRKVSDEEALRFVRSRFWAAQAMTKDKKTLDCIMRRHLRGASFDLDDIGVKPDQPKEKP